MKLFLDDQQPLHTCKEINCESCDVHHLVSCHFNLKQLVRFLAFGFPLLIISGISIFNLSLWALVGWVVFTISYFGLIEIRVMCSHCPHYGEPALKSLKCWANYGSPVIWKYRPGPMSSMEKIIFFSGALLIFLSPLLAMLITGSWLCVSIYAALVISSIFVMGRYYCNKCMNFACPFNRVDSDIRNRFFKHNPVICQAWEQTETQAKNT